MHPGVRALRFEIGARAADDRAVALGNEIQPLACLLAPGDEVDRADRVVGVDGVDDLDYALDVAGVSEGAGLHGPSVLREAAGLWAARVEATLLDPPPCCN